MWISVTPEKWHSRFLLDFLQGFSKAETAPTRSSTPSSPRPRYSSASLRSAPSSATKTPALPSLTIAWRRWLPAQRRAGLSYPHGAEHWCYAVLFSSFTSRFLPWTSLCFMLFHWQNNIRPLGKQGSQNFLWFILFPLLSFLLLQLFPSDKITDKGTKVITYTVIRFPCTFSFLCLWLTRTGK